MNRNRCISWLLTLALMVGLFSPLSTLVPEAQAAGSLKPTAPVLDGFLVPVSQVTKVPAGFTGVYTAADLLAISDAPNDNYILMADIDLSGYKWKPLCSAYPFTGVFEGNGHVITGLNGCGGLFDSVKDGTVRNVGVENATIYPDITVYNLSPIGGIVGELRSSLGLAMVSNCYFSGNIHDLQPPASASLSSCTMGGIVGECLNSLGLTVEHCWMKGDIVSDYLSSIIGGIVGISETSTINDCIHMGNIRAVTQKRALIGGICGNGYGEFIDCQNWGSITYQGPEANVAGIINYSASPGPELTRCMNAADISVTDTTEGSDNSQASTVGGLLSYSESLYDCFNCGDIFADGCCKVGGLAGGGPRLARNCYNTGRITAVNMGRDYDGTSHFASLGGWPWDLENCFGLVRSDDITPLLPEDCVEDYLVNVRGLSESQMSSSSSFTGFDFDSVWTMGGSSYPYPVLQSMNLAGGSSGGGSTPQPSSATIPTPVLDDPACTEEGVSLSWSLPLVVPGETHTVDGFYILRKTAADSYQRIGQVGEYAHSYVDTSVQEGQTYTYTIQAYYQDQTGDYNQAGKTITWESSPLTISEVNISGGYPMLPLQGGSEVLLTLKAPLPERYLEDGKFTGSVRLMAGDRLLSNGTEVVYEPEYMELCATFSPGEGGHFPPNTEAEIQVVNAEGYVIGRAPCKTYFQQWAVANFSSQDAAVPERLIYLMLWGENSDGWDYETRADQLVSRGVQPGKGGFCFGMALAVSLVNWLGTYDFGGYDILDETGDTVQKLAQVDMEGEFTGISAVEFIQLCHIAQFLWPIQDALDENKWDYSGLIREIDRYQAGECPMPIAWISSTDSKTKDKSSHALGAYDYRLDGGDAYILCYDCNLPGVRKELKLSSYKTTGSAAWSFETLGWQGSQQENSDNYFTYYTPEKDSDIFIYAEQSSSAALLSTSDQNTLDQVELSGGLELRTISYLASSYLTADANPFSGGIAWLTGKGSLTLTEATGETTLADGVAAYSVNGAERWSSELSEGTVTELSARGQGITLSCTYYTEDGAQVDVSFTGDSDDGGKDISVNRTGDTVRFSGGGNGTVTVTYENGETWTEQVVPGQDLSVTADGKKAPSMAGGTGAFRNVPAGSWYYDAVQWAVENGVTSGTGPDTFSPDRACTRSEVVTLLWRALGLDEVSGSSAENPFRDVPTGSFYYDAVLWAAENGITTGSTPTTFSPNAVCTRSEVVTFLWRTDFPLKRLSGSMDFTDVNRGDFFWYPVKWAVEEEITTGTSDTTFSPMLTCTRAQVVTFLYRFFSREPS